MIDAYYWPTPNGWKISIMLEECALDYRLVPVDIGGGDQFKPDFLRIAPNNRMPAIVDHAPADGGEPLALFESGAILEYLAEKTGLFLPQDARARYRALQWVHWQMANLGPMMGNANHFRNYGKNIADDPRQLEYGIQRFVGEVGRLGGVMDAQLSANEYLAGSDYSIADIVSWPWAHFLHRIVDTGGGEGEADAVWERYPNLKRWVDVVGARPAVQKGREAGREFAEREHTEEELRARRELLFNQTDEKVRAAREAAARAAAA